jgi:hypothetical protein
VKLFEMSVQINGWVERVQVTARDAETAYAAFCSQYGKDNCSGWPSLIG